MQKEIHPKYYKNAKIICDCGNEFTVGSTQPEIHVEICHKCHPLYTGKKKVVDTAGRVEKFQQRMQKAQKSNANEKKSKEKKKKGEKTKEN